MCNVYDLGILFKCGADLLFDIRFYDVVVVEIGVDVEKGDQLRYFKNL